MKSLVVNLAVLLAALALVAGVGEVVLRWRVGAPIHWRYPQERYIPDPEIGYWMEPGQTAFTHDQVVEVNALGLRARELARDASADVVRVLALGDSQTFGNGLALEDTWPKQLEQRLLARDPGVPWEVVNAGLAGSSTWQQRVMLERLQPRYEPQIAVVGFYVNDVLPRPDRIDDEVAAAHRTNTWRKRIAYALKRSALVTAVWQARHVAAAAITGDSDSGWETHIVTGAADARVAAGWDQVARSLEAMRDFAAARDVELVVVAIPRRDQVSGAQPETAYQRHLSEIAAKLGLVLVDPLEPLRRAYATQGDGLFIAWDGHNAASANAIIAEALADRVIARHAPQSRRPASATSVTQGASASTRLRATARLPSPVR